MGFMVDSLVLSADGLSKDDSSGTLISFLRQRFRVGLVAAAIREPLLNGQAPLEAAVLVPIVLRPTGPTVLLTQRTAHLRDHAGQISFPGGRSEAFDPSPEATALREADEEVGLSPRQVEILGRLPAYHTVTGFCITPVVGLVTPPLNLKLDDFEVAEVFEPPLAFLMDAQNHQRHQIEFQGAMREYWAIPWQDRYIWGATAGMLVSLHDFLFNPAADAR
jgi:8-oxo-dGTP pyrophosphatase MutT (NUDIX family)